MVPVGRADEQVKPLSVEFVQERLKDFYTDITKGKRSWMAWHSRFRSMVEYIESAQSFLELQQQKRFGFHALKYDYRGWYAMRLGRLPRLILRPMAGDDSVVEVDIVEDYHRLRQSRRR